jgi:hypothetical protein
MEEQVREGVGQAALRPEFAELYPGIPPNEWRPTTVMMDSVLALPRYRQKGSTPANPVVLNGDHFIFRGVASAGAHTEERQRRRDGRRDSE